MSDIPAWFWMVIIAGLSGMLGLIMYYMAMLLRESTLTVRETKYIIVEFHDILDSMKMFLEKANRIADTTASTIETVSTSILKPLAAIGVWVNGVRSFVSEFTGEKKQE
jgi:SNF family Na+-dependent transporter